MATPSGMATLRVSRDRDIRRVLASARCQARRQDVRRSRHFDHPHRKAPCRIGDDGARDIGNGNGAGFDRIGRNAVAQTVGLPLQREVAGSEIFLGHRFMRLAAGVRGAGDDAADKVESRIIGQRRRAASSRVSFPAPLGPTTRTSIPTSALTSFPAILSVTANGCTNDVGESARRTPPRDLVQF